MATSRREGLHVAMGYLILRTGLEVVQTMYMYPSWNEGRLHLCLHILLPSLTVMDPLHSPLVQDVRRNHA